MQFRAKTTKTKQIYANSKPKTAVVLKKQAEPNFKKKTILHTPIK